MLKLALIAAAAVSTIAAGAHAATTVSFASYQTALNPGETLYTRFDTGLPSGATGTGSLVTGSSLGITAAPAFSATSVDTSQYFKLGKDQIETFDFGRLMNSVSIYVGSLDNYNGFAFNNGGGTYWGDDFITTGAIDDGSQTASWSNGRLMFAFSTPVTTLTLSSNSNALEISDIAVSAAPEPAIWALMFGGLAMIGGMLRIANARRRENKVAGIATA